MMIASLILLNSVLLTAAFFGINRLSGSRVPAPILRDRRSAERGPR